MKRCPSRGEKQHAKQYLGFHIILFIDEGICCPICKCGNMNEKRVPPCGLPDRETFSKLLLLMMLFGHSQIIERCGRNFGVSRDQVVLVLQLSGVVPEKTRRSESTGCRPSPAVLTISTLYLARRQSIATVSVATNPAHSPSGR